MNELKGILSLTFQKRQAVNPGYSQNAFARDLGVSPTALSQFLSGKRTFSRTNIQRIVNSLSLPQEYNKSSAKEPDPFTYAMRIKMDTFSLIADWHHLAILNLIEIESLQKPEQIVRRLNISVETAQAAVERMIHLGLMERRDGTYHRTQLALNAVSDAPSEALRKHNREKMELAIESLDRVHRDLRDITSMTVCFDTEKIGQVKKELTRFKKRLGGLFGSEKASEVYSLNLQFFPLTQQETPK